MPAAAVSIDQTLGNCASDGGIYETQFVDCAEITDVTIDNSTRVLTGFTMAQTGQWAKLTFDSDDTAFYNENSERNNLKLTITQEAFMKFAQVTAAKINAAQDASQLCCVVAIHRTNSGINRVQGIQYDVDADTWKLSKTKCTVTPNILTDTGDNEDRVEYTFSSVSSGKFSITTDLTSAAITAL